VGIIPVALRSRRLPRDFLFQNLAHGQGDDDLAALAEEGVYFAQGVAGVVERDEEALGAVLASDRAGRCSSADRCKLTFERHPNQRGCLLQLSHIINSKQQVSHSLVTDS